MFSSPDSVCMNRIAPISVYQSLVHYKAGLVKWLLIRPLFSHIRHSASQGIITAHSPQRDGGKTYETQHSNFLVVIIIILPFTFSLLHYDITITTFKSY